MPSKMTPDVARTLSAAEQHEWFRSRTTSRRSLLRGGLVGAGAVAGATLLPGTGSASIPSAALLAPASRPSGAVVAPFGRHVAFGADPTRQMAVSWLVPALVGRPFVRIGTSPWDLSERVYADLRNLTT